jgi:Enterobacterial TraT complement resistance protein
MNITTTTKSITLGALALALSACAATETMLEHGSLEVSTQQSKTLFLDPVADSEKIIYVSIRNTSSEKLKIEPAIKESLKAKGYKLVTNPGQAHYLLQANILNIGKMSEAASHKALYDGYGGTLVSVGAGAGIGALATKSTTGAALGAMSGGLLNMAANSLVKDVNYTMITDIKVTEQIKGHKESWQTRVVSTAEKVNLKFKDAQRPLEEGLVQTISGIF